MTESPSPLDRLEARLDAQAARIDELYRLLHAASTLQRIAEPRRRPSGRRDSASLWPGQGGTDDENQFVLGAHVVLGLAVLGLAHADNAAVRKTGAPARLKRIIKATAILATFQILLRAILVASLVYSLGSSAVTVVVFLHVAVALAIITQASSVSTAYDMWEEGEFRTEAPAAPTPPPTPTAPPHNALATNPYAPPTTAAPPSSSLRTTRKTGLRSVTAGDSTTATASSLPPAASTSIASRCSCWPTPAS